MDAKTALRVRFSLVVRGRAEPPGAGGGERRGEVGRWWEMAWRNRKGARRVGLVWLLQPPGDGRA